MSNPTATRAVLALFLTAVGGVLAPVTAHAQGMTWQDAMKGLEAEIRAAPSKRQIVSYALVARDGKWYRLVRKVKRPGLETSYVLWGQGIAWFMFNPEGKGVTIITSGAVIASDSNGFIPKNSQGKYKLRGVFVPNSIKVDFVTAKGGKEGLGGVVLNAQPDPPKSAHSVPEIIVPIFPNRESVPARYQ